LHALLLAAPQLTAVEAAAQLDVSERTVRRYLALLREYGAGVSRTVATPLALDARRRKRQAARDAKQVAITTRRHEREHIVSVLQGRWPDAARFIEALPVRDPVAP